MIYDAIIRKRIDSLVAARRYHRKVAIKIYWHVFPNIGGRCKIATLDSSFHHPFTGLVPVFINVFYRASMAQPVVWKIIEQTGEKNILFYFRIKLFIRKKTLLKIKSIIQYFIFNEMNAFESKILSFFFLSMKYLF